MNVSAVNGCYLFLLLRFMCTITVTHQGFGFHILLLSWLVPLLRREQEETQYLQPSLRRFAGSCEWASSELSERHRLSVSVKTFLTSTVVLRLGHSPQERTITNQISPKSHLFLPDSAPVIWRAYGKRQVFSSRKRSL